MKPSNRPKQARRTPSQPTPPPLSPRVDSFPPFSRLEIALFAAVLMCGTALRLHAFSHSAVEHFDEGVYASNIYFGPPDYAYPQQRFFGPPLLPALIETGMTLQLPPNVAALLPSFLAGCGTIVALWWFGRSWFGVPAGITAAGLAAFSDFQILFSTGALTDALLGFWLLLAVDAIGRSLLNGDLRWAVGAGLYTGLAWWTKYNGWLPLAIEVAAIALLLLAEFTRIPGSQAPLGNPRLRSSASSWLVCFALTALVATVIWSLYLYSLKSQGGYAPIAANHAKYFVGLAGWLNSVWRQFANQQVISSWLGALGIFTAISLPALFGERTTRQRILQCAIAATLGLSAWIFSSIVVLIVASSVGLLRLAIVLVMRPARGESSSPEKSADQASQQQLLVGFCLVAVWWLGLLLSTPCYTPYSRLLIPFTLAAYLAVPLFTTQFAILVPRLQPGNAGPRGSASPRLEQFLHHWSSPIASVALFAISIAAAIVLPRPQLNLSPDRLFLQTIAREIHQSADANSPRIIYTFGEPAIFFQLRASGEQVVAPVQDIPATYQDIDGRQVPTFLIAGPHTEQDSTFQQQWATAGPNWALVQTFNYVPSPLVYLDLHDPRVPNTSAHAIHLYQLKSNNQP